MKNPVQLTLCWPFRFALIATVWLGGAGLTTAAEPALEPALTNAVTNAAQPAVNVENLRLFLQMQDQLHATMQQMRESRLTAEAAEKRNSEYINARLNMLEEALRNQRNEELERQQSSNRILVTMASVFGGVTLVFMLLMAWQQHRTMERLSDIATSMPTAALLGSGSERLALPQGEQLLSTLHRIEQNVRQATERGEATPTSNGGAAAGVKDAFYSPEKIRKREALIGRADACAQLNQHEDALQYLDEALHLEPGNIDLLMKKATVLTDIKRQDEALACLDQVIATDPAVTLAYLRKGAVFNQLGRHREALDCYDQALKFQERQIS